MYLLNLVVLNLVYSCIYIRLCVHTRDSSTTDVDLNLLTQLKNEEAKLEEILKGELRAHNENRGTSVLGANAARAAAPAAPHAAGSG